MRFQKAELCSAAVSRKVPRATFPPGVHAPALSRALSAPAVAAIALIAAMHPPLWSPIGVADIAGSADRAFAYWSSILLEAAPFVVAGTVAAAVTQRCVRSRVL